MCCSQAHSERAYMQVITFIWVKFIQFLLQSFCKVLMLISVTGGTPQTSDELLQHSVVSLLQPQQEPLHPVSGAQLQ